jgi:hypothetical protein
MLELYLDSPLLPHGSDALLINQRNNLSDFKEVSLSILPGESGIKLANLNTIQPTLTFAIHSLLEVYHLIFAAFDVTKVSCLNQKQSSRRTVPSANLQVSVRVEVKFHALLIPTLVVGKQAASCFGHFTQIK